MKFKLHSFLIKKYRRAKVYRKLYRDEIQYGRKDFSWLKRVGYLLKGFNSNKSYLYDLENHKLDDYYKDLDVNKVRASNLVHGMLLDRKDIFHNQMARLKVGPNILGTFVGGSFYPHQGGEALSCEEGITRLPEGVLVRPSGSDGYRRTLRKLVVQDGKKYIVKSGDDLASASEVAPTEIGEIFKKGKWKILEPIRIDQSYLDSVKEGVFGLLRITTRRNKNNGDVSIQYAIQQIGKTQLIYCSIDLNTGKLGQGLRILADDYVKQAFTAHPETGNKIDSVAVSNWEKAKELVLYTHRSLPNINAATWHLVETDKGWKIINAANRLDTVVRQCLIGPFKDDIS